MPRTWASASPLLIPLNDAHKNNRSFKIHLFGGEDENENISIQSTDIFPKMPAALANSRRLN
jgi:hypothetical protein